MKKFIFFLLGLLGVFYANKSMAQCSSTTVPYYQDFSGITSNNQLPNCWAASNLGGTCLTFTNMGAVAAFSFSPGGNSQFFTEAIQLNAGIVYSVSLWYRVSTGAPGNWANLSVDLGASQSTIGVSGIALTSGVLTNTNYVALTATFVAPGVGNYYFSIGATGQPTANAQFLYWDDFELTAPCSLNPVLLYASSSHSVLCAGNCATLTASGADSYAWNNGAFNSSVLICPTLTSIYSVIGTNALTGCTAVASPSLQVNPVPQVSAFASPSIICIGESSQIQAFGASTYTWSGNQNGNSINVSPTQSTTYTVTGDNSFCTNSVTLTLNVDACLDLRENLLEGIRIFPNPINEILHIQFETEQQVKLELLDANGKTILDFFGKLKNQDFETKYLSQGIYTIRLETEVGVKYIKLIKN